MALLVIFPTDLPDNFRSFLLEKWDYQDYFTSYHGIWPTKEYLPPNTLFHPTQGCGEAATEIFNESTFYFKEPQKVIVFEVGAHATRMLATERIEFDHGMPTKEEVE